METVQEEKRREEIESIDWEKQFRLTVGSSYCEREWFGWRQRDWRLKKSRRIGWETLSTSCVDECCGGKPSRSGRVLRFSLDSTCQQTTLVPPTLHHSESSLLCPVGLVVGTDSILPQHYGRTTIHSSKQLDRLNNNNNKYANYRYLTKVGATMAQSAIFSHQVKSKQQQQQQQQ